MFKRRRFKQTEPLVDRLAAFARIMRERAELMPAGPEKADALMKARQAAAAAEMDRWIGSSELTPPK